MTFSLLHPRNIGFLFEKEEWIYIKQYNCEISHGKQKNKINLCTLNAHGIINK